MPAIHTLRTIKTSFVPARLWKKKILIFFRHESSEKIKSEIRHHVSVHALLWTCYFSVLVLLNSHRLVTHIYSISSDESHIHWKWVIFYRIRLNFYIGRVGPLNFFSSARPYRPVYFICRPGLATFKCSLSFHRSVQICNSQLSLANNFKWRE